MKALLLFLAIFYNGTLFAADSAEMYRQIGIRFAESHAPALGALQPNIYLGNCVTYDGSKYYEWQSFLVVRNIGSLKYMKGPIEYKDDNTLINNTFDYSKNAYIYDDAVVCGIPRHDTWTNEMRMRRGNAGEFFIDEVNYYKGQSKYLNRCTF